MSSSKSWIVQSVKRRLGFTIVIAAAAFGTAVITGNSLVVIIIGVAAAVVFGATLADRDAPSSQSERNKRARGEPYSLSCKWSVDQQPNLEEISRPLYNQRFSLRQETKSPEQVILRGGSQLWTRLLGGYFVDPKRLPMQVELRTTSPVNDGRWIVELGVRDKFGIAVRDKVLEDRFMVAAGTVRETVEAKLKATGDVEINPTSANR